MTKVIKGKFKKIKNVKVEDVSLTCDTPLEVFNNEVSRLSEMDDDLFTYEVEVANIPCNSNMNGDSEHEADDDKGYVGLEWYEALEDCELKDEALRNKAIMKGSIKEDDDESCYEQKRRWNIYTNYDDSYEIDHENNEREELCEVHELPVCIVGIMRTNIRLILMKNIWSIDRMANRADVEAADDMSNLRLGCKTN
ncbi:hypothetical protein Tco_1332632, partial [Tanacetum coccineum]